MPLADGGTSPGTKPSSQDRDDSPFPTTPLDQYLNPEPKPPYAPGAATPPKNPVKPPYAPGAATPPKNPVKPPYAPGAATPPKNPVKPPYAPGAATPPKPGQPGFIGPVAPSVGPRPGGKPMEDKHPATGTAPTTSHTPGGKPMEDKYPTVGTQQSGGGRSGGSVGGQGTSTTQGVSAVPSVQGSTPNQGGKPNTGASSNGGGKSLQGSGASFSGGVLSISHGSKGGSALGAVSDNQKDKLVALNADIKKSQSIYRDTKEKTDHIFAQLQGASDPEEIKRLTVAYSQSLDEQERAKLGVVGSKQEFNEYSNKVKKNAGITGGGLSVNEQNDVVKVPQVAGAKDGPKLSASEKIDKYGRQIENTQEKLQRLSLKAADIENAMAATSNPEELKKLALQYGEVREQQKDAGVKLAYKENQLEKTQKQYAGAVGTSGNQAHGVAYAPAPTTTQPPKANNGPRPLTAAEGGRPEGATVNNNAGGPRQLGGAAFDGGGRGDNQPPKANNGPRPLTAAEGGRPAGGIVADEGGKKHGQLGGGAFEPDRDKKDKDGPRPLTAAEGGRPAGGIVADEGGKKHGQLGGGAFEPDRDKKDKDGPRMGGPVGGGNKNDSLPTVPVHTVGMGNPNKNKRR